MKTEQTNIFEFILDPYTIQKPIRLIELFAGIGAQAKALENIGADFVRWKAIEIDRYAMDSYNAIHRTDFKPTDIKSVHASDLEISNKNEWCYVLTYSFPCQDLSQVGTQRGMAEGTRSGLLWEVERILDECETLPEVLLMENVPNVIGKRHIGNFTKWRSKLERLGYSNFVKCLNAKNYGIPQNRNRCFMVSIHGDWLYTFPRPKPLKKRLADMLETNVAESYFLSEEYVQKQAQYNEDRKRKHLGFRFQPIGRDHKTCKTITTKWWDYNTTILEQSPGGERVRRLTEKECWRLMGFSDDDFGKAECICSNTQLLKQAGNSIAVPVLEAIFKQMMPNEERGNNG